MSRLSGGSFASGRYSRSSRGYQTLSTIQRAKPDDKKVKKRAVQVNSAVETPDDDEGTYANWPLPCARRAKPPRRQRGKTVAALPDKQEVTEQASHDSQQDKGGRERSFTDVNRKGSGAQVQNILANEQKKRARPVAAKGKTPVSGCGGRFVAMSRASGLSTPSSLRSRVSKSPSLSDQEHAARRGGLHPTKSKESSNFLDTGNRHTQDMKHQPKVLDNSLFQATVDRKVEVPAISRSNKPQHVDAQSSHKHGRKLERSNALPPQEYNDSPLFDDDSDPVGVSAWATDDELVNSPLSLSHRYPEYTGARTCRDGGNSLDVSLEGVSRSQYVNDDTEPRYVDLTTLMQSMPSRRAAPAKRTTFQPGGVRPSVSRFDGTVGLRTFKNPNNYRYTR